MLDEDLVPLKGPVPAEIGPHGEVVPVAPAAASMDLELAQVEAGVSVHSAHPGGRLAQGAIAGAAQAASELGRAAEAEARR